MPIKSSQWPPMGATVIDRRHIPKDKRIKETSCYVSAAVGRGGAVVIRRLIPLVLAGDIYGCSRIHRDDAAGGVLPLLTTNHGLQEPPPSVKHDFGKRYGGFRDLWPPPDQDRLKTASPSWYGSRIVLPQSRSDPAKVAVGLAIEAAHPPSRSDD